MTDIILPKTDIIQPPKPEIIQPKKKRLVALKPSQVLKTKRVVYEFEGKWLDSFGKPENIAKWFITGMPYSGKSSFSYELCTYLCNFGKVDYDSLEEGNATTSGIKISRNNLDGKDTDDVFKLLPKWPIPDFKARLLKKRSAQFGVVDSVQHAGMNKKMYDDVVDSLCIPRRGKSMLFINHWVKDDLTKHIKHDCDIKIEVRGFIAYVESRYADDQYGNKPFLIYEKKAKEFWGKRYKDVMAGRYWPGIKG